MEGIGIIIYVYIPIAVYSMQLAMLLQEILDPFEWVPWDYKYLIPFYGIWVYYKANKDGR